MVQEKPQDDDSNSNNQEYLKAFSDNLNVDLANYRIMAYKNKAPQAPEGFSNSLRVVYSCAKTPCSTKKNTRFIPQAPEKILDAPEIKDDYCSYYNLIYLNSRNFFKN